MTLTRRDGCPDLWKGLRTELLKPPFSALFREFETFLLKLSFRLFKPVSKGFNNSFNQF